MIINLQEGNSTGKTSLSNKRCWGSWICTRKGMREQPYLTPYIKINSRWIKDVNVRAETISLRRKDGVSVTLDTQWFPFSLLSLSFFPLCVFFFNISLLVFFLNYYYYFLMLFLSAYILFMYVWLCWVVVSERGLSLVAASGGHSSSQCTGLSLSRPLLLRSTGSRRAGSVIVAHGPSCSAACGVFPDQGSNPRPLHWQADSQPLRHQGSPIGIFLIEVYFIYIVSGV